VEKLESDRDAGAVCPYIEKTWRLPNEEWLRELWLSGTPPNGVPTPRDGGEVAVDFPLGAPMLIRRSVLTGMNYVDERYGDFGGDAEICFRIRNGGKKIVVLPDAETDVVEAAVPADTPVRSADVAIGAATYLSKHFGGGTGFRFRLSAMLRALGKIVTFQRPGYYFSLLMALVTNQKIDGTQSES
jgi:cellulose synthase/poly-beta-1,6-N-acetylglucosamine synthase-like glycosyltransferase